MFKVLITLCLISNPTVCKIPIEVMPANGAQVTSLMSCLKGGVIASLDYDMDKYFAKVTCTSIGENDFQKWMNDYKNETRRTKELWDKYR